MVELGRNQRIGLGVGVVVLAILLVFGIRSIRSGDSEPSEVNEVVAADDTTSDDANPAPTPDDDESAVEPTPDDDESAVEPTPDDDESAAAPTPTVNPAIDPTPTPTIELTPEPTAEPATTPTTPPTPTAAPGGTPTLVLSDITLTRTGVCASSTVATDVIVQFTVDGATTMYTFPDDGSLRDDVISEGSNTAISEPVSQPTGTDWNVSVFTREHLVEGSYSNNHSSPASVVGSFPGPANLGIAYDVTNDGTTIQLSSIVLNASSDCETVAPTVFVTYTAPDGTTVNLDNGLAQQKPATLGQPVVLLAGSDFELVDGWQLTVFIREDWNGRAYNGSHPTEAVVSESIAINNQTDPEIVIDYSIVVENR